MDYKTAFITGASSGIGAELARVLARRGVWVGLAARRKDDLQKLASEIANAGGRASVYALDVADVAETKRVLQQADDELGGIELLVANAGTGAARWSGKLSYEDCAQILAVNVNGAVATITAVLPRMVERGRGHVVGVSSLAQYRGLPENAAYCASKAFLSTFLEGLRIDLYGTGVSVTDVRPGFVRTAMTAKNKFKMPFMLEVDEAADIILKGVDARHAVVAFPWQLASITRAGTVLPSRIYDRVVSRAKRDKK